MNRFERVDNIFETEEPFRENYNPERTLYITAKTN